MFLFQKHFKANFWFIMISKDRPIISQNDGKRMYHKIAQPLKTDFFQVSYTSFFYFRCINTYFIQTL